jgi:hypothetical protein
MSFREQAGSSRRALISLLRRLGFVLKGSVIDPEEGTIWEWSDENAKI